jgi:hypothetical protein
MHEQRMDMLWGRNVELSYVVMGMKRGYTCYWEGMCCSEV